MKRISVVEYGTPKIIIDDVQEYLNLSKLNIIEMLIKSGEKVQNILGYSQNPISIHGNAIKVTGFAGILRVSKQLELEIAPKFLGLDEDNETWREDFFYLASLSSSGNLLKSDHISSRPGENSDLHFLIAKTFIELYWKNHRRSLRTYRTIMFNDFSIEGECEPESLINPSEDGFEQTKLTFDRNNQYNAVIFAAAKQLLPNLNNPELSNQLMRIIQILTPQKLTFKEQLYKKKLPTRLSKWQDLYNLSVDIVLGYGLTFQLGNATAPGYIFNTWKVWEDFILYGLIRGFGRENVKRHSQHVLGVRQRIVNEYRESYFNVIPDAIITNTELSFIVDAKYKGRSDRGPTKISEQDVYESLAFSTATGINMIILVYPMKKHFDRDIGQVNMLEKIVINDIIIIGVEVESKGISKRHAMDRFSKIFSINLTKLIHEALEN